MRKLIVHHRRSFHIVAVIASYLLPIAAAQHLTSNAYGATARVADTGGATSTPRAAVIRVADANTTVVDIVVRRGRRISGPSVIKVKQGDNVTLRITNDAVDELHLHGYNLQVPVMPEKPAVLQFTAKLSGRFTFELHKTELELGAVEVYPN
jgi:FtsP/CotA-like multicopper oxidase with cupredoxin domain